MGCKEFEYTDHDKKTPKKGASNSYKFNCTMWNELPPLLGIYPRKEHMSGMSQDRWSGKSEIKIP